MTMTLNAHLGGGEVRRGLTALLRRRVPAQEVEDVAQTVLADALAAPRIPTDPEELRKWLSGIARHKIADFHRRAGRAHARNDASPVELLPSSPAAFEEREVLHVLLGEKRSRREAEAMEWLVREHEGERLADIAAENGLPAPVVRQRVSRLRRALRSRWAGALAVLALVGGLGALGALAQSSNYEAIAPDPSAQAITAPAASPADGLLASAAGDWTVQTVTPNRALTAAEQRLVDLEAKNAKVHIEGRRVVLSTPGFSTSWTISRIEKTDAGARIRLTHENGTTESADVVLRRDSAGPHLDVTLTSKKFGGTVSLRRPTT
jgi:DNA-directed RNA polymerase specialized sigma24 family protein